MKAGDHIRVHREGGFLHGIDVGDRTVIAFEAGSGPRRVLLTRFSAGARPEVVTHTERVYAPKQVVARAFSRFSEAAYATMFPDSEAFAVWCKAGRPAGAALPPLVFPEARAAAPAAPARAVKPAARKAASTKVQAPVKAEVEAKAGVKAKAPAKAKAKAPAKPKAKAKAAPKKPAAKAPAKKAPARKAPPAKAARAEAKARVKPAPKAAAARRKSPPARRPTRKR